jgi:hypothetical protein
MPLVFEGPTPEEAMRQMAPEKFRNVKPVLTEKTEAKQKTLEQFLQEKFKGFQGLLNEDPNAKPDQFLIFIGTDGSLGKVNTEKGTIPGETIKNIENLNLYSSFAKGETGPLVAQKVKLLEAKYSILRTGEKKIVIHRVKDVVTQQNILEMAQLRKKMQEAQFAGDATQKEKIIASAKDDVVKTYTHAIDVSALEQLEGEPDMGMK